MKQYQHTVQYYETDQMGIVHHSNYIRWMEEARMDFFRQIGWDYKAMEDAGIISPVISVQCRYLKMTKFSEIITIAVYVEEFKGVKLKLRYKMSRDGVEICRGYSEHGFLDSEGTILNMKKVNPDFYQALQNIEGEC